MCLSCHHPFVRILATIEDNLKFPRILATESCVFPEGGPTYMAWHYPYTSSRVRFPEGDRSVKLLLALTTTGILDSECSNCFLYTG
jgi:hypothetical protein